MSCPSGLLKSEACICFSSSILKLECIQYDFTTAATSFFDVKEHIINVLPIAERCIVGIVSAIEVGETVVELFCTTVQSVSTIVAKKESKLTQGTTQANKARNARHGLVASVEKQISEIAGIFFKFPPHITYPKKCPPYIASAFSKDTPETCPS